MSTATEITRLTDARNTIRTKLVALGLAQSTDKMDALATEVDGIANRGAVDVEVREGESYTVPAGYHNGSGTVKGVAGGGSYNLQAKTATPTTAQQSITPDQGYYGLSGVTVNAIPSNYKDVSSTTAIAGDVLANKVFIDAEGVTTTGTMANNGAVSKALSATDTSYTVPAGYHNGSGAVNIVTETKTATPTKSTQTISATSGKVIASVTVNAIPDEYQDVSGVTAAAGDVLAGVYFVDDEGTLTEGTMVDRGTVTQTLDTSATSYTIAGGKHSGSGTVSIVTEEKSATPSTSAQNITPTTGKVLSKVTVAAIPAIYGDATDADITAEKMLEGTKAVTNVDGVATLITGSMVNRGTAAATIDGTTTTSYTISAGYYSGGTVSLDSTIETALAAI